jgi:O-antigen/teichoic acid export membrane protein
MREFMGQRGAFLGWSFLSNLAFNGYAHTPPLILGLIVGPEPVAIFQALRNFSQPLGTLQTAIENFDKPRAALALDREGVRGMRRQLNRTGATRWILGGPYMLLMVLFHEPLVEFVYSGRYVEHSWILILWVVLSAGTNVIYPFETALLLFRRADLLFRSRLLAAGFGMASTALLAYQYGVAGAMAGLIIGSAIALIFTYAHFSRSLRAAPQMAAE